LPGNFTTGLFSSTSSGASVGAAGKIKKARLASRLESVERRLVVRADGSSFRDDVDALAVLVELDLAVDKRKERPIAAGADIRAGRKFRAALADDDAARGDELAAVAFYAKPFAGAVASVANAALTFFMCHN